MATQVLGIEKQNDGERGASFLDFKLKRRRLSEIVGTGIGSARDLDNQSTMSSESGYGSQTDRNSEGKCSSKEPFEDGSESEIPDLAATNEDKKAETNNEETVTAQTHNLHLPPPYFSENPNFHIGVAYVSFDPNSKTTNDNGDGLKVGLIPVMDGMLPFTLKGLSGIRNQNFPEGTQPLFMTSMPGGFVMTNSGPSMVMAGQKVPCAPESVQKHKLAEESRKTCQSKKVVTKESESEFIDHYTNGLFEYLGHRAGLKSKEAEKKKAEQQYGENTSSAQETSTKYDNIYPMVCGICNDKATGLHYGIITCEG